MILKTLEQCEWNDIPVGEIFAVKGCWEIHYKSGKYTSVMLADDVFSSWFEVGEIFTHFGLSTVFNKFYKLPLQVQHLWKEE